jgi:hypothetical protein
MSEHTRGLAAKGEHPGQQQLNNIFCQSKSPFLIDLWNKEGNICTQYPNVAWEKKERKQLKPNLLAKNL